VQPQIIPKILKKLKPRERVFPKRGISVSDYFKKILVDIFPIRHFSDCSKKQEAEKLNIATNTQNPFFPSLQDLSP
jgi:hypothetical protein